MEEESLALYTLKAHSSPVRIQVGAFVPCCPSSYSFLVAEESWLKHFSCSPSPFLLSIFTLTTCQTYWRVPELHTPSAPPSSLRWGLASAPPRDRWSGWCWNNKNEYSSFIFYQRIHINVPNKLTSHCRALTRALQIYIPLCLSLHPRSTESLLCLLREVLEPPAVLPRFHILCTSTGCPLRDDATDTQDVTVSSAVITVAHSFLYFHCPPLLLTAFFTEDEEELCSRLLHTHVNMCHEANQFVSDGGADLWPDLHILQWGKYLEDAEI